MKTNRLIALSAIVALALLTIAAASRTPILRGFLQSDFDGNNLSITNLASASAQNLLSANALIGEQIGNVSGTNSMVTLRSTLPVPRHVPQGMFQLWYLHGPDVGWTNSLANDTTYTITNVVAWMIGDGLRDAGFNWIMISVGCNSPYRDSSGAILWNTNLFPEGMQIAVDYCHSNGFYVCIYTEPTAYLYNSDFTTYNGTFVGTPFEKIHTDVTNFAAIGFDAIEVDFQGSFTTPRQNPGMLVDCTTNGVSAYFQLLHQEVAKCGRPMEIKSAGIPQYPDPWMPASINEWDQLGYFTNQVLMWSNGPATGTINVGDDTPWSEYIRFDLDMLRSDLIGPGHHIFRNNMRLNTTVIHDRTIMAFSAIECSDQVLNEIDYPWISRPQQNADLRNKAWRLICKDPGVIQGQVLWRTNWVDVDQRPLVDTTYGLAEKAILLYNRKTNAAQDITCYLPVLGYDTNPVVVLDVFNNTNVTITGGTLKATAVPTNSAILFLAYIPRPLDQVESVDAVGNIAVSTSISVTNTTTKNGITLSSTSLRGTNATAARYSFGLGFDTSIGYGTLQLAGYGGSTWQASTLFGTTNRTVVSVQRLDGRVDQGSIGQLFTVGKDAPPYDGTATFGTFEIGGRLEPDPTNSFQVDNAQMNRAFLVNTNGNTFAGGNLTVTSNLTSRVLTVTNPLTGLYTYVAGDGIFASNAQTKASMNYTNGILSTTNPLVTNGIFAAYAATAFNGMGISLGAGQYGTPPSGFAWNFASRGHLVQMVSGWQDGTVELGNIGQGFIWASGAPPYDGSAGYGTVAVGGWTPDPTNSFQVDNHQRYGSFQVGTNGVTYANGGIRPGVFTVATLPTASAYQGVEVYCSDVLTPAGTGERVVSDGTNWRTMRDNIIATTTLSAYVFNCAEARVNRITSKSTIYWNEIILPSTGGSMPRNVQASGTGAGQGEGSSRSDLGRFGYISTGTTTTGAYKVWTGGEPGLSTDEAYGFGGNYIVSTGGTPTDQFYVYIGFGNNVAAVPTTAACGFLYDPGNVTGYTGTSSSTNNWWFLHGTGGALVATDTGVAVTFTSATAHRLGAEFDASGITAKVDSSTIFSDSTDITESALYNWITIVKTAGTTSRLLYEARPWLHIRQSTLKLNP